MQRDQRVSGVGFRGPLQEVSRQFLAVESDLDADAGLSVGVERGRDAVVEGPVEMRKG